MEQPELRTSHEWQVVHYNKKVTDPDGWDRKDLQYSWYEELITEEEYKKRVAESTCMQRI